MRSCSGAVLGAAELTLCAAYQLPRSTARPLPGDPTPEGHNGYWRFGRRLGWNRKVAGRPARRPRTPMALDGNVRFVYVARALAATEVCGSRPPVRVHEASIEPARQHWFDSGQLIEPVGGLPVGANRRRSSRSRWPQDRCCFPPGGGTGRQRIDAEGSVVDDDHSCVLLAV